MGLYLDECVTSAGKRADVAYARRVDSVKIVEAKPNAGVMGQAFRQIDHDPANYKWLALLGEEYQRSGGGIVSTCGE